MYMSSIHFCRCLSYGIARGIAFFFTNLNDVYTTAALTNRCMPAANSTQHDLQSKTTRLYCHRDTATILPTQSTHSNPDTAGCLYAHPDRVRRKAGRAGLAGSSDSGSARSKGSTRTGSIRRGLADRPG